MMARFKRHILPALLALLLACVKPYEFNVENYEKVLVVDGRISSEAGPYTVKIGYTYPLESTIRRNVTDAEVWVEDGTGRKYYYYHVGEGVYSSQAGLDGTVGNSYALFIETADGVRYQSEPQEMLASPAIDTIYGRYAQLPDPELQENVGGIQFFLDSKNDGGKARHFRYEYNEAYKILTPYQAVYGFNKEDSTIYPLEQSISICYQEGQSAGLIYGTSVGTAGNRITEFPIRFCGENTELLRNRYTIEVLQHAISESAYLYYKRLKENNEAGGSFFDQQTGTVYGNMRAVDDSENFVLGFFEVSGVSKKRVFFSNSDLDSKLTLGSFPFNCYIGNTITTSVDSAAYYLLKSGGHIYFYDDYFKTISIQTTGCTSCDFYADTTPPDYWIE